jgi:hypothetical protein
METLSYGFLKPQNNDLASVWWEAMRTNAQKMNDHTHDGANSPQLTPASIAKFTSSIAIGDWAAQGNGVYRATVTVPGAITEVNNYMLQFVSTLTPFYRSHLTVERQSATTFYVYTNNNVAYTVLYI